MSFPVSMTRILITASAIALLSFEAVAQVGVTGAAPGPSPLGVTSPLGIGPASPVASTGLPLGATELASPGLSPMPPMTVSGYPSIGTPCSSTAGTSYGLPNSMSVTSSGVGSSTVFDGGSMVYAGGGTTGTASGTCSAGGRTVLGQPSSSASSPTGMAANPPVGPAGISLGATELGSGGLSPPPLALTINPSMPLSTLSTSYSSTPSTSPQPLTSPALSTP